MDKCSTPIPASGVPRLRRLLQMLKLFCAAPDDANEYLLRRYNRDLVELRDWAGRRRAARGELPEQAYFLGPAALIAEEAETCLEEIIDWNPHMKDRA